jgi:hypothetical protein
MKESVWAERKWNEISEFHFYVGDGNVCSSTPATRGERSRACDSVSVLLPTAPSSVLHNWLSTAYSVIALLSQLAPTRPSLLLKFCQVERMWCTPMHRLQLWKIGVIVSLYRLVGLDVTFYFIHEQCQRVCPSEKIKYLFPKLSGFIVTTAWRVFRFCIEEAAIRIEVRPRICCTSSHGRTTMCVPLASRLCEVLAALVIKECNILREV